ncbi:hypothetical protein JW979_03360, partial [bacterium]|nr:hypothetical protein [candidate division CSSED10-310 bacterium]
MAVTSKKTKPVTPEDFYFISDISDLHVRPGGESVAYVLKQPEREGKQYLQSIWMIDIKTKKSRQFTSGGKPGDFSPVWSLDGNQLAF